MSDRAFEAEVVLVLELWGAFLKLGGGSFLACVYMNRSFFLVLRRGECACVRRKGGGLDDVPVLSRVLSGAGRRVYGLPRFRCVGRVMGSFNVKRGSPVRPAVVFTLECGCTVAAGRRMLELSRPDCCSTRGRDVSGTGDCVSYRVGKLKSDSVVESV